MSELKGEKKNDRESLMSLNMQYQGLIKEQMEERHNHEIELSKWEGKINEKDSQIN